MKKQTPANPIRFRRKPLITALEPRILLDGAAVATTAEMTTDVAYQDEAVHTDSADQSVHFAAPAPTGSEPGGRREVAFVDTSVEDHQSLVDGLGDKVEVILIEGSDNGLEQMVAALQGQSGIDAIHLFSHGDVGELQLGTLTLNGDNLQANAELLTTLGQALNEAGDLMLYGCYVGADSEGQSFIDAVAELTQADVAASSDATGSELKGGDWSLEYTSSDTAASVETDELVPGEYDYLLGAANADFESGLDNWSTGGTVQASGSVDHSNGAGNWNFGPADSGMAYLSAVGGEQWSTVSQGALALGADGKAYIDEQFPSITQLSYIYSDITLAEGESVSFAWNYLANDYAPYNDGSIASFVNLTQSASVGSIDGLTSEVAILGATVAGTGNYSTGDYKSTGWQTIEFKASTAGTYRVAFSVFDLKDTIGSPFLFVDDQPGTTILNGQTYDPISKDPDAPPPPGNSSPEISGSAANLTVGDNSTLSPFSSVTLNDNDGDNLTLTVTLDSASKGSFTSASLSASGFTDNGNGSYSLASTSAANAQAALRQLVFQPVENRLSSGTTENVVFTIVANDGTDSASDNGTLVQVTSVNDAPSITVGAADAVTEVGGDSSAQDLSASGNVAFNDVDASDVVDITFASNNDISWSGGTLDSTLATALVGGFSLPVTIDASVPGSVSWNYALNDVDLDFLATGETLSFSYTLTATDSQGATATDTVSFTLTGSNDAPTLSVAAASGITEAVDASAQDLNDSGAVSFADLDSTDLIDISFASNGDIVWSGATLDQPLDADLAAALVAGFSVAASDAAAPGSVNWTYSVDNADLDFLAVGETISFSYTVTADDGNGGTATDVVSFTLTGTNDAPTVSAAAASGITEAVDAGAQDLSDSGEVSFADLDRNDLIDIRFAANGDIVWSGATLDQPLDADLAAALVAGFSVSATDAEAPGKVNWHYSVDNADLDFLAVGETITFSYTVTADDGNGGTATDVVSFTLTGTNDAPTITAAAAAPITEAVDAGAQDLSDSGEVSFADLDRNDLIDISFQANNDISWSGATLDQPLDADLAAALVAGFSVAASDAAAPGSVNWTYSVDNADLDFLAVGETLSFSYTVTADDGNGGTATDVVSFTLTGTNDAPTVSAAAASGITEAVDAGAQDLSDSGEVSFADLDSNDLIDIRFASNGDIAWSGASLDQPLDADLAAALVAGFSVSATDAEAPGKVNWTYSVDNADLDFLAVGETLTFSYTVTADDGNGGTATDVVSFTLTGTNDAPTVSAAAASGITEAVDAGAQDLSDSGEVSFADLDSNDLIDIRFASNGDIAWSGASLDQPLDADLAAALVAGFSVSATDAEAPGKVNWTYSVDNADLDFLAVGETLTFSYTVTADDGNGGTATDVVSFTLTGTNDAPTVSAAAASGITEAVDAGAQDLSDSGEVSFADLDSNDLIDIRFASNGDIAWSGATLDQPLDADLAAALVAGFSVSATDAEAPGKVNWHYSVDNADLDFLAVGETLTFSYTVTADDGNGGSATDVVSFTLTGTNDAPTVSAAAASAITEAVDAGAQDLSDSGEVSFADLDSNDLIDIRFAANGDIAWSGATLDQPLDADLAAALVAGFSVSATDAEAPGKVNWTYSVDNADLDFLAVGETLTFSYTVTADDGNGGTATDVVSFTLTGTNDAPTVSAAAASGITEAVDAGAQDLSDSGEVSFADLDRNDLIDIRFASNGDIAWSGATIDQPLDADLAAALVAGFSVSATDAEAPGKVNWHYSVDNADLDFLAVGETLTFSYTVTADDGNGGTATDVVSFTLTGTNDAPTVSAAAASAITEAADAGAQDLSDSGEVSFADLDSNDLIDIRFAANGDIAWSGATLDQPLDADLAAALVAGFSVAASDAAAPGSVNWTYSVDNADLDFLAVGETLTFSYTITADDGNGGTATDVVSFTLTGTNDAPTVSAAAASGITEAVDASAQDLSDSGEVSFADLDSNDRIDIRFAANGDIAWSGATLDQPLDADLVAALVAGFSVSATDAEAPGKVNWTYSVDNADLDFLAVGETLTFSYTVTADDGNGGTATDVVSFTLTGTNDAPTVSAAAASGITEAVEAGAQDLSDSGEVSFADLDSNDRIDISFAANGDIAWSGATIDQPLDADLAAALVAGFSVAASDAPAPGSVNWTYSVDNADLDFLAVGETLTFSYTVTADDGNGGSATDVVSFTLTGTNDAPTVSAAAASGITEAVDAGAQDLSDSGEVSFADLDSTDLIDIRFASNGDIVWSGATLDQPLDADLAAALVAGFSVAASDAAAPGSVNWTYSVDNADLDFLAVGETISFSYTITADDGNGGTATDVVSFTLTGTNDAPTITAAAAAPITEAVDAGAQDLSDSGEVSFADLDSNDLIDIRFAANGDIAWSGATLDQPLDADLAAALVAGFSVSATDAEAPGSVNWHYSVDNADLDFLAVGETLTFSYTVTADDGNGGTATDVVSFTLTGTNDAPTVSAAAASGITEAVDASAQDLSDSGEVSFADLDSNDRIDIRFAANGDIAWSGATLDQPLDADLVAALVAGFSVSATDAEAPGKVNWTYSVDNADLDFLAVGETISFSYTITADDGNGGTATDVVSFTLTGTNDAPTITAAAAAPITEAVDAGAQDLSDSGEVSFADLDSNDLIDIRFAANGDIAWSGATLDQPLDADLAAALVAGFSVSATDAEAPGSVNWHYSVDNADLDFLAVGETLTFSYTVTADDGNRHRHRCGQLHPHRDQRCPDGQRRGGQRYYRSGRCQCSGPERQR